MVIAVESWGSCASEIELLARASWEETVPELEPGRVFGLDKLALARMDEVGVMKILTARAGGQLVGYISWTLQFDLESLGVLLAHQGSWYARPGAWGVGWKLLLGSLEMLKALGVSRAYCHWRLNGRAARAERFFRKIGGTPIMTVCSIPLGAR